MAFDGRTTQLDCEEASEFITPRKQTSFPRVKAGIALTAIAGVLCLAATYATGTYPFQQDPWAQYHRVQGKMLEAFKSRALLDKKTGFTTSVELVAKEEDAEDPDAMSVRVNLVDAKAALKWPKAIMTLEAKKGKQRQLKKKLLKIWDAVKNHMCKGSHNKKSCQSQAPPLAISAGTQSTHFNSGSWTFIELPLPHNQMGKAEEKDLEAVVKDDTTKPDVSAKLSFGRTIQDMFKNKEDTLPVLPGGIKAKMSATFASIAFQTMAESGMMDKGAVKMIEGLASLKARLEVNYKKPGDLKDAFDMLPRFTAEISQAQQMLKHQPKEITDHLLGLEDLMEGIKGVVFSGVSGSDEELLVKFVNFHPAPVFTDILDKR